jgi:D-alanyl-D-alanine carboxypeptidase
VSPAGTIRAIALLRSALAASLALGGGGLAPRDARAAPAKHRAAEAPAKRGRTGPPRARAARRDPNHAGKTRAPGRKTPARPERIVPAIKGGLPNVQAQGALVIDDSGRELYARRPDGERPIASISKLAAALVVADRGLDLEGLSTINRTDIEVARGGARSRLAGAMTLSNRDLLHAALMGSDNRAIPALGRAVRLSPPQLAAAMTAKARALGLKHTRFREATGLSSENVSTPRETIALLRAVTKHPVLGPITGRIEYDAHPVGRSPVRYVNTYRPAVRGNVEVLGGKTGYNDDARYCLVIATRIGGQTYYMSFLGNEGKLTRFGDVARVADWIASRKPGREAEMRGAPAVAEAAPATPADPPAPATSTEAPAPAAAPDAGAETDPAAVTAATALPAPGSTATPIPLATPVSPGTITPAAAPAPP